MTRIVAFGLVALVLVSVSGCSGPDALMKELITNLNVCAEMIENQEPKEKVLSAFERANATAEKLDKMKLSPEEQEELFKKYDEDLKKVAVRLEDAQKKWKLAGHGDLQPIVIEKMGVKK